MSDPANSHSPAVRPEFRNIHALRDLPTYKLPVAGIVSILHRVSGALMFVLLPLVIWLFDTSISSEISFARFKAAFHIGLFGLPGALIKLLALALVWAYLHHLLAGLRHVWMDVHHDAVTRSFGKSSALGVLAVSLPITLALGAKLFGLY